VRPTDENQAGSRRPNLMSSSRRTGGEINILAMLEGQSNKPLSRRFQAWTRAAWYGGAGLLACGLLGALAWVALDPAGGGFEGRVVAGTPAPVAEPAPETLPNPALHVDPAPAHGAAIVDVAATESLPPPRAREDTPPHAAARAALVAAAVPAATAAPMPAAATDTVTSAVTSAVTNAGPARVPAAVSTLRPALHAAPRPTPKGGTAAHAAAVPPHPRRAAPLARPGKPGQTATVDTDVALISAIIQHAGKHGEAKDDKPATPHPTAQP